MLSHCLATVTLARWEERDAQVASSPR
jgi:hypothetical protein